MINAQRVRVRVIPSELSNNFPPINKRLASRVSTALVLTITQIDASTGTIGAESQFGVPLDHVILPDTVRGPRLSTVQAISLNSLWTCKLQPDFFADPGKTAWTRICHQETLSATQHSTLLRNLDAMSHCGADGEKYRRRGAPSCCSQQLCGFRNVVRTIWAMAGRYRWAGLVQGLFMGEF